MHSRTGRLATSSPSRSPSSARPSTASGTPKARGRRNRNPNSVDKVAPYRNSAIVTSPLFVISQVTLVSSTAWMSISVQALKR